MVLNLRTATGEQAGTQESTDPSTPSGLKLRLILQVSTYLACQTVWQRMPHVKHKHVDSPERLQPDNTTAQQTSALQCVRSNTQQWRTSEDICAHDTEVYDKIPSEPHETEKIDAP